jgi:Family of unknown function (DUF6498)
MAILLGGFVSFMFGNNIGLLVLLIVGKTMLDLSMHLSEREKNAAKHEPIMPEEILHEAPHRSFLFGDALDRIDLERSRAD